MVSRSPAAAPTLYNGLAEPVAVTAPAQATVVPQPVPAPSGFDAFTAFYEDFGTRLSDLVPVPLSAVEGILRPSGLLGLGGLVDDVLGSLDYLAAIPGLGLITTDVLQLSGRHDSLNHRLSDALSFLGNIYIAGRPLGGGDGGYLGSLFDFIPDNRPATYVPAPEVAPLTNPETKYSVILIPDTQYYVNGPLAVMPLGSPELFKLQTQWIADNIEKENIVFVSHLGDVVDNARSRAQFDKAAAAMATIEGKVPYAVLPGNHDFYAQAQTEVTDQNPEQGVSPLYLEYFGQDRFRDPGYDWYGGTSPNGMSSYQFIQMGDVTILHISLEKKNLKMSLPWAKDVIETFKGMPTMISTHANVTDEGEGISSLAYGPDQGGRDLENGQFLFDYLIKDNPQVFMVNNGHYSRVGAGQYNAGEITHVGTNAAGQPVLEVLSDYQFRPYGGDGYFRQIEFEFRDGNDIIAYRARSATPGKPEEMDANSRFVFDQIDFQDETRFGNYARPETRKLALGKARVAEISNGTINAADGATILRDPAANIESQALLRFDQLDDLPDDARIISAVLVFQTTDAGDGANLYRMDRNWAAYADWNSFGGNGVQPGDEAFSVGPDYQYFDGAAGVAGGAIKATGADPFVGLFPYGSLVDWDGTASPSTTVGQRTYVDVTQSVRAWIEDGDENFGWVVTAPQSSGSMGQTRYHTGGDNGWSFVASGAGAPMLLIEYEGGAPVPERNYLLADDIDRDGRSDIIWANQATNAIERWTVDARKSATRLGVTAGTAAGRELAGIADIDGDRVADLVFRDAVTRDLLVATSDDGAFGPARVIGNAGDATLIGLADIDGNGASDVLLRRADGKVIAWSTDGQAVTASAMLSRTSSQTMTFVGAGDFDGNGTDDLIWHSSVRGQHQIWFMDGQAVKAVDTAADFTTRSEVLAIGDFNGDGKDDLVVRGEDGRVTVGAMNRNKVIATRTFNDLGPDWTVAAAGDYSGDGKSDLIWQNRVSKEVQLWVMSGGTIKSMTKLGAQSADWFAASSRTA